MLALASSARLDGGGAPAEGNADKAHQTRLLDDLNRALAQGNEAGGILDGDAAGRAKGAAAGSRKRCVADVPRSTRAGGPFAPLLLRGGAELGRLTPPRAVPTASPNPAQAAPVPRRPHADSEAQVVRAHRNQQEVDQRQHGERAAVAREHHAAAAVEAGVASGPEAAAAAAAGGAVAARFADGPAEPARGVGAQRGGGQPPAGRPDVDEVEAGQENDVRRACADPVDSRAGRLAPVLTRTPRPGRARAPPGTRRATTRTRRSCSWRLRRRERRARRVRDCGCSPRSGTHVERCCYCV